MKKKLLIGLLASLAVCTVAVACGESDNSSTAKESYTLTLRDGNPMLGGTSEESTVEEGATLTLPTPTADGKMFKGWVDVDGNPAPATMPAEALALYATWDIIPFNMTVVNGSDTVIYTFGADYDFENGINYTVNDLKNVLKDALPENNEEVAYVYAESIPETFELQSYAFTVQETASYELTVINGDKWDPSAVSIYYMAAGDELDFGTPMAEGKTFAGWITITYEMDEYEMETEVVAPAPETMPEAPLTIYASWNVVPYTITITLPEDAGTVTVQIGVEDVYDDEWNTIVYDYTNGYGVEYAIGEALKKVQTDTVAYEVEGLTYDEEGTAVFSELKNYEFTAKAVERVDTVYLPDYSTLEYKYGDTIELPTPEAMEGAEFVKWVYYVYNEELGDFEIKDVPETATADIDEASFKQIWNVTPYTLTIKQAGQEDMVFKFGAMTDFENGIEMTVSELAWTLMFNLPENTEKMTYAYSPEVPETFTLQNYEFTIVEIEKLSLADAVALGNGKSHNEYTEQEYLVTGTVVNVANTQYGNLTIADAEGNTLYVYGSYLADGTRYDAMETKPVVGDVVTYCSTIGNYNGQAQLKNAVIVELISPETVADSYKVIAESFALSVASVTEAGDVKVATAGATYTDVAIAWASSNANIAAVNGGVITFTLPAEATTVTLTATITLNDATYTKDITVSVAAAPAADEKIVSVTFGTDNLKGTQYADESYTINEYLTVSTHNKGCHFTSQLRIYDSDSNDGWAMLTCAGAVSSLTVNVGNKAATLRVMGSTDGTNWTLIEDVTTTVAYADKTISVNPALGFKYIKLDAVGAQLRITSLSVSMIK